MATRDVPGSLRIPCIGILVASTVGLAGCGPPPNADVIAATLCVSPASAANDVRIELERRIHRGGYGTASAAKFGAQYVDLLDPLLRPSTSCCGNGPSFAECAGGATPVDLFVDLRREMTPEEKEQVRRQLETELDAAYESVRR